MRYGRPYYGSADPQNLRPSWTNSIAGHLCSPRTDLIDFMRAILCSTVLSARIQGGSRTIREWSRSWSRSRITPDSPMWRPSDTVSKSGCGKFEALVILRPDVRHHRLGNDTPKPIQNSTRREAPVIIPTARCKLCEPRSHLSRDNLTANARTAARFPTRPCGRASRSSRRITEESTPAARRSRPSLIDRE
jgi:hypothetical protein